MRYALIPAILIAGLTTSAQATDPAPFEWTKEKFDYVSNGDAAEGKKLAKKFRCKKCHNDDGVSDDPEVPSIAGQRATYMYKQLMDFKNEVREDEDMLKSARKLDEQQMIHISAFYQSLERPAMIGGQSMLQIKVCDSCHEKDIVEEDNKIEVAPILAGQVRQYLEETMMQFKESGRANDLFVRMQSVSHKLTEDDIRRLAKHYAGPEIEE